MGGGGRSELRAVSVEKRGGGEKRNVGQGRCRNGRPLPTSGVVARKRPVGNAAATQDQGGRAGMGFGGIERLAW